MKEQYYGETFARTIMFTDDIEKFLKKFEQIVIKLDADFAEILEVINKTIFAYASSGFVNDKAKCNIYFFLYALNRINLSAEAYKIYSMYYQEMITMLNSDTNDNKIMDFYRFELSVRKNKKAYLSSIKVPDSSIEKKIQDIKRSITFDSDVLVEHLSATDADFSNHQIHYVTSPYYVESFRYLIYKYPGLLNEESVKDRISSTLAQRDCLNKKYRKSWFVRFKLDKTEKHICSIKYGQDNKL